MTEDERHRWAMDRLPFPYAEALRLYEAGITDEVIAEVLGVDINAVDSVLDMAARKLAVIRDRDGG
ncbi:hypothetical protein ACWF9G_06685 [Nocardia sp. NPDC055029]|uniref:hypothetical protein n=1 Tax=Nocardia sp. NPDC060259 TaxID=3347088 RepID=UPI00365CFA62